MSTEGLGKKYSPEEIAALERTRIQDPEEAHEEANMLSVKAERKRPEAVGKRPTAEDYSRALAYLAEIQEKVSRGSESVDKITTPIRNITAGSLVALAAALDVIPLAVLTALEHAGMVPKENQNEVSIRQALEDRLGDIRDDYERFRAGLASARERLEKWKTEADEFAKKQNETAK